MPSHISLFVISHTIKWKHFFSSNESPQLFNPRDIIFISGKYVVENSEECVTVAYASIIDAGKPEREFDMIGIPVCDTHLMVSANVNRNPKKTEEFIHFGVECTEYNAITGSSNIKIEIIVLYASQSVRFKHLGLLEINIKIANNYLILEFIKFSDFGKILIEATDIDYQKSSIYYPTVSEISPDKSQKTHSISILLLMILNL
ncbi:29084_t:CDS:2, partial [Gigaspora margarita]